MGLSFSSGRRSRSEGQPKTVGSNDSTTYIGSAIVDLMKPECLKMKKKKKNKRQSHPPNKKISKVRKSSLDELLEDSPVMSSDRFIGPKRVHPSATRAPTALSSGERDNFSMEKSVDPNSETGGVRTGLSYKAKGSFILEKKVRADEEDPEVSAISKSKSEGSKKVRFRLPKKTDIVFYSPDRDQVDRKTSLAQRLLIHELPAIDSVASKADFERKQRN